MSETATTNDPVIAAGAGVAATRRSWPGAGRLLLFIGLAMLAALVLVTLLAPLVAPYDPSTTSPNSLEGSSAQHWLGTDAIGRDVLSRILVGGRTTLFVTFTAVALALVAGLVLGLVSGYVGGWVDEAIMR